QRAIGQDRGGSHHKARTKAQSQKRAAGDTDRRMAQGQAASSLIRSKTLLRPEIAPKGGPKGETLGRGYKVEISGFQWGIADLTLRRLPQIGGPLPIWGAFRPPPI